MVNFIHHLKSLPPHSLPSLYILTHSQCMQSVGNMLYNQACNSFMFHANKYPVHAYLPNAAYKYGTKTYTFFLMDGLN